MVESSQPPDPVFEEGLAARANGDEAAACPYTGQSGEAKRWLAGWHKPDEAEAPDELGFA